MATMQSKVQILYSETRNGVAKSNGKPYSMTICQASVHSLDLDGKPMQRVGELVLPKDHPVVDPGFYIAHFEVGVDQQTKRIAGYLRSLTPYVATPTGKTPFDKQPEKV